MYSDAIIQSNNPKVSVLQLRNNAPEAVSIPFLPFDSERLLDDPDAPLLLQVGSLPHDILDEVPGECILLHCR